MQIIDLTRDNGAAVEQAAEILVEGFKENWPGSWPDLESGRAEVEKSFAPGRISRIAVDENGVVRGWIGGVPEYGGKVYVLHPVVVRPGYQGQGIGQALVADLEEQARALGAVTLYLGTDDIVGMTTLGGQDVYPNVLEHLANVQNLRRHPFEFYLKLGFSVSGIVPDANGFGKPDILMAKRIAPWPAGGDDGRRSEQ